MIAFDSNEISHFTFQKKIGEGTFGQVFKAKWDRFPQFVFAVKRISKLYIHRNSLSYQTLLEKTILEKLQNPGIVKLYYCFQDEQWIYYVLEYVNGCQLRELMSQRKINQFEAIVIFWQISEVVKYIHSKGIVHRDLKPQNILICPEGKIKLIDFGTAFIKENFNFTEAEINAIQQLKIEESGADRQSVRSKERTLVGTAFYVSPQLLKRGQCFFQSDVWALGCILYQLIIGETPFPGENQFMVFQKIKKGEFEFAQKQVRQDLKDLITWMLRTDPLQRPSFKHQQRSITKSAVFKDFDKHQVFRKAEFKELKFNFKRVSIQKEQKVVLKGIVQKKMGLGNYKERLLVLYANRLDYYDPFNGNLKGSVLLSQIIKAENVKNEKWQLICQKKTYQFKVVGQQVQQIRLDKEDKLTAQFFVITYIQSLSLSKNLNYACFRN